MSKKRKNGRESEAARGAPPATPRPRWLVPAVLVAAVAVAAAVYFATRDRAEPEPKPAPSTARDGAAGGALPVATSTATMETGRPIAVRLELDYGPKVPAVEQALADVDRRYTPDDGKGRTFAILGADGWTAPDGKLVVELSISSEKAGYGALVFRPTGAVLWSARIVGAPAPLPEDLTILVDDGTSKGLTVDGSKDPPSVLEATILETGAPVTQVWRDGEERDLAFLYSACGCTVRARARREGDRAVRVASTRKDGTVRPAELPVIFPDDPKVAATVERLMKW